MHTRTACKLLLLFLVAVAARPDLAQTADKNAYRCYAVETAVDTGQPGYHLNVAMTVTGTIHIIHWDAGTRQLQHTRRQSGVWSTVGISGGRPVVDLTMALGPTGEPTAAYINETGQVVWLDPALGDSSAEVVNPSGPVADRVTMATDKLGRVKLLFYSAADGGDWYAERVSGAWSAPRRLSAADGLGDLALSGVGTPWVVLARGQDLVTFHRQNTTWIQEIAHSGVVGLGSSPAITIDRAESATVAWTSTDPSPFIYRSYRSSPWIKETIDPLAGADDPVLSINEEPWSDDINVTYLADSSGTFRLFNRFSALVWDERTFWPDGEPILEAAASPHATTGLVMAFRRNGRLEVRHQEVVPSVSGFFYPNPAIGGNTASLNFSVICADRIELDGQFAGGGTIAGGTIPVPSAVSRPYVLKASNGYASASVAVNLTVVPFGTVSLQPSVPLVALGDPVTLTWEAEGADVVQIEPGGYTSAEQSGSLVVHPTADTTYELFAENTGFGTTNISTSVATALFSEFRFLTANNSIVNGEATSLNWSATGADSISIEPGGFTTTASSGILIVSPTDTTTYVMTAVNAGFGQQTAQITIAVDPLRIASFTADPQLVVVGEPVTLSWQVDGSANVELRGFGSQPQVGTATVYPTTDEQFVLIAEWNGFVSQRTVELTTVPYLQLAASFSRTEISRDPSGLTVGVPFDVFIHWLGPPRLMLGLEFGLDLPATGVYIVDSQTLLHGPENLGTNSDWQIYGSCFAPAADSAVARLSLLTFDPNAFVGEQIVVRGITGELFPESPGYRNCDFVNKPIVAGPPLPLDLSSVGVATPTRRETRITRIHPNPFNPRTNISFSLRGDGDARLEIYDLAGRRVRSLPVPRGASGPQVVRWDGLDRSGRETASGVYIIRLTEAGAVHVQRAALLR